MTTPNSATCCRLFGFVAAYQPKDRANDDSASQIAQHRSEPQTRSNWHSDNCGSQEDGNLVEEIVHDCFFWLAQVGRGASRLSWSITIWLCTRATASGWAISPRGSTVQGGKILAIDMQQVISIARQGPGAGDFRAQATKR